MLSERNRQIAFLKATTTLTHGQIAQQVGGCHRNTISRALKRADVQKLISEIQGTVQEKLIEDFVTEMDKAATPAFRKLLDLMDNASSPAVQLRACESVLDRASQVPKKILHAKHEVDKRLVTLNLSKAEIDRMHKALLDDAGGNTANIPPKPQLQEDEEYVAVLDQRGRILGEGVRKIGDP